MKLKVNVMDEKSTFSVFYKLITLKINKFNHILKFVGYASFGVTKELLFFPFKSIKN